MSAGPGLCDAGMCTTGYRRSNGQMCEGTIDHQWRRQALRVRGVVGYPSQKIVEFLNVRIVRFVAF